MSFNDYTRAGFATELLPILPHDARINRASPSFADLEGSKGKVPGRKVAGGTWFGFAEWSRHVPSAQDIKDWAGWGSGIGLQGRKYPGLDIDVEDREVADAIETTALLEIGLAPARFGRGSRRLLVYAGAGLKKRRLAFRLPGRPSDALAGHLGGADDGQGRPGQDQVVLDQERAEDLGVLHAVELLGEGQQYVVEGIHPKTGQPYAWRGPGLAEIGSEALTPVTDEEIDAFFAALEWAIVNIYDGEIVENERGAARARGEVDQETLEAPSLDDLRAAIACIPNDETVGRGTWTSIGRAIKAAGGEDAYDIWDDWSSCDAWPGNTPEENRRVWDSFNPPHEIGWPWLKEMAKANGFNAAAYDFEPVAPAEQGEPLPSTPDSTDNMFQRFAWIEGAKRAVHLESGVLLDQEQFEFRVPPRRIEVKGRPTKTSAWTVFKDAPKSQRKSFVNLTFRPGAPRIVEENLPDLQGPCYNLWREPKRPRALPAQASDDDVRPYLDLAEHVIPNEAEREHVFDYMAYTLQHQGQKIHHALVLGSRNEGVGKDTLLEPLRAGVGRAYVREITAQHLAGTFNAWVVGTKLVVVQEMHNFERKETMNRLKPLVAAPPEALPVNMKHRQEFFVPNIMNAVFFTNEDDALALSKGDRRYFVTWNDGEPMPQARYEQIWGWLNVGGVESAIRWLLSRDVSRFDAKGRAPMTEAKAAMRKMSRSPLSEWIEDGIEQEEGVFARRLLVIDEVADAAPDYVRYKGHPISRHKLAKALVAAGAEIVSGKVRIEPYGARRLWAVRGAPMYRGQGEVALRDLYLNQKADADQAAREHIGKVMQ